jgi:hypothetical protein
MAYKPKVLLVSEGGTGQATLTNHGILVGAGTANVTQLATGTSGQMLQSSGSSSDPAYSTTTYPTTNAVSTLLYASSANVMAALATANNGVLTTNSSGVPSIDTTNFAVLSTGLQLKGNNANTAPPASFIGEQIRSAVGTGAEVSISNNSLTNMTSIALSAGIWDISLVMSFSGMTTVTSIDASISTTSITGGTYGDNRVQKPGVSQGSSDDNLIIPAWRLLTTGASTTVYAVAYALYTVGTGKCYGRLSATRVG